MRDSIMTAVRAGRGRMIPPSVRDALHTSRADRARHSFSEEWKTSGTLVTGGRGFLLSGANSRRYFPVSVQERLDRPNQKPSIAVFAFRSPDS